MSDDGQITATAPDGVAVMWTQYLRQRTDEWRLPLIEHYLPLVKIIAANSYAKRVDESCSFLDRYQSGVVGLLAALEGFDPQRDVDFKTFATPRIKGEILNALSRASEVASQLSGRKKYLQDRVNHLGQQPDSAFEQLLSLSVGLAIGFMLEDDRLYQASADEDNGKVLAADSVYQSLQMQQLKTLLHQHLHQLTPRQRQVIRLHYFQGLLFADIAQALQLSKGRVSQLHQEAIDKLKVTLANRKVDWQG
ncbi:sigma-70 family RNA polymerase sigma factor [Neisseriaceae bacterium TC5R-5]|nr:sigma-70 family RNA polymerase sigma factor [Neisseriaceae bacterium TC5R-5]